MHGKKNEIEGYFLITSDFVRPKGYQGATAVGVEIDTESKIISAEIIESLDTKTYIRKIKRKKFMSQFCGHSCQKIEAQAVSGATMTCNAIEQSIRKTLEIFQPLKVSFVIKDGTISISDTTYTIEKIK